MKTQLTGYCTIIKRKNNKAIQTFKTIGNFTEEYGIAMGVIKGLVGKINKEIYENIKGYFTNKKKKIKLTKESKDLMNKFDKDYRILLIKN